MSKSSKKIILLAINWILVAAWAVFIFSNSADNSTVSGGKSDVIANYIIRIACPSYSEMTEPEQENLHSDIVFIVRKGAHVTEFAILGVLVTLLVRQHTEKARIWYPVSVAASVLYAATDEFHQLYVPGRAGQLRDVLIDSAGVIAGCTAILIIFAAAAHHRRKRVENAKPERR